jgi:hypothetical protein
MYICQLVWKKINQEITVVHKHNPILTEEKKSLPLFKKKSKLQITARNNTLEMKKLKKSYPYVHTLSLASKECKRLL